MPPKKDNTTKKEYKPIQKDSKLSSGGADKRKMIETAKLFKMDDWLWHSK
jgi:hypothetical protein